MTSHLNNLNNLKHSNFGMDAQLKKDPIHTLTVNTKQITERLLANKTKLLEHSILDSSQSELSNLCSQFLKNRNNAFQGIDAKSALALTSLGFSMKETGYEGWNLEETTELYTEIFDLIEKQKSIFSHSISPAMKKSLLQLKEVKEKKNLPIHERATFIMQKIQELSPGESYTMKGGWYGYPCGHTMLYRFEKNGAGTFNVYVYDAPKGGEIFKGGEEKSSEAEIKSKVPPCFILENLTEEELFFSKGNQANPSLIENLLSLRDEGLVSYHIGFKTFLQCFAHLKHRLKFNTQLNPSLLISSQRSGKCPVKSMNCLLLHLENDYKKYKEISLDTRLLTILGYYQYFQKILQDHQDKKDKKTELFMLKEAATNYLRFLDANVKKQELNITTEQYTTACATIYDLLQNLESIENELNKAKKPVEFSETYDPSSETKKNEERQKYASSLPILLKIPETKKSSETFGLSPTLGQKSEWKSVGEVLTQLNTLVDRYEKGGKNREIINQVEVTLRHLSHLKRDDKVGLLQSAQILSLGGALCDIQEKYNKAVFAMNDLGSPSVLNTGMEFLALSYRLSLVGDKDYNVLSKFGLYADYFFKFAREDHLFTIPDPVLIQQRRELESFFKKINEGRRCIFNFEKLDFEEKSFLEKKMDDGAFLIDYIEKHPSVREEFKKMWQGGSAIEGAYKAAIRCFGTLDSFPQSLAHLGFLKKSAVFACELSEIGKRDQNSRVSMKYEGRDHLYIETKVSAWNTKGYQNYNFYNSCKTDFSASDQLSSYTKNSQSSHKLPELKTENVLLIEQGKNAYKKMETDPHLPFYLALAEPGVQTSLLLNGLEDNLQTLSDPDFRVILKEMFLKVVEKEDQMFSPFLDTLTDHQLTRIEKLAMLGKQVFVDSRPLLHPQWNEILFLCRLYAQGLQTFQSKHQDQILSTERIQHIQEALQMLEKLLSLSTVTEELKIEIKLAKVGLLLGTPLIQLSSNQQADLILTIASLKNSIFSKSICSDYPFWRECKRKFFELEPHWVSLFKQEKPRNDFGNAVLRSLFKLDKDLKWTVKEHQLTATSSDGESWSIDWVEPMISNSSGSLLEQYKGLEDNPSLKRLFAEERYHLKIFDEETRFFDAKWGNIRIFGKGNRAIIQRQIDDKWYTYIPLSEKEVISGLKINRAIFYDHTLWFNEKNPQDVRIYDLKLGKEFCHTIEGDIQHCDTQKQFYSLENNPLLQQFENLEYINGWVDEEENILEFSRYRSKDGHPLNLKWNEKSDVWDYSINPDFHLDEKPSLKIDFATTSFLPLVSKDGTKRKFLIPSSEITSLSYSPKASINRKISEQDNQKGSMIYFEYDVTEDGNLIAQTMEANIYLAQLYLAQKRYQKALAVLKSLYSHDQVSKNTIQILLQLINSGKNHHDFCPNASSIRLQAFMLLHRISPFAKREFNTSAIKEIYFTYLHGLNNLENGLILDPKTELKLINIIVDDSANDKAIDQRKNDLNQLASTIITTTVDPNFTYEDKSLLAPSIFIDDVLPTEQKQSSWLEEFFDGDSDYFLGHFKDFEKHFEAVKKAGSSSSPVTQALFYQILTRDIFKYPNDSIHEKRLAVLLLAAYFPKQIPQLPSDKASKDEQRAWLNKFKEFYTANEDNIKKFKSVSSGTPKISFDMPKMASSKIEHSLPMEEARVNHSNKVFENHFFARNQDQNFSQIQNRFLEHISDISIPPTVFLKDSIPPLKLHRAEKKYEKSIKSRIEYYSKDCKIALKNENKKMRFKKDVNYELLLKQIREESTVALDREGNLEKSIHMLANKSPFEFNSYVHHQAHSLGRVKSKHPLETILRASARKNGVEALMELNSYLSLEEARELQAACVEFMVESTHRQHLVRIENSLKKWLESGKKNNTEFELAQEALAERRVYTIEPDNLPSLLFEYTSKMRIREKQVKIINQVISIILKRNDEKLTSSAFQLIMGGGKTSVIISMLIEMLSEAGMLVLVMSNSSQLSSTKGTLSALQPKRFKKPVHVIDYSLQDLSKPEILDFIIKTLEDAKENRYPIVMRTTFPQIIASKFIIEALNVEKGVSEQQKKMILKLQKILNIFHDDGVSIFDEGDTNLSILLDVNIPIGKQKMIRPERSDLIKKIFEHLNHPELKELLNFKENKKAELSLEEYEEQVLSFVADAIFDYSPLKLKHLPQHKEAFQRYVCDLIEPEDQGFADDLQIDLSKLSQEKQENILFIRELKNFSEDSDRYKKEAANLIAITRRVFTEVLRISLSRSNNQNYGRKEKDDGQVIPFEGTKTPTKRQFADVYLGLAYQYQSALEGQSTEEGGISKSEIEFLAERMTEAATHYAKDGFENTLEAKQFLRLTSVKLDEISDPTLLEKAWKYVNDPEHTERLLAVEAEVAPFYARYFTKKVKNNAINKVSLTQTSLTCSGALWNWATFHRRFGKADLDEGTEGSILNLHSKKEHFSSDGKSQSIHEIGYPPLKNILKLIKKHPEKSRIRALVDAGGFLKDHHMHDVADALLKTFAKEKEKGGPQIDAVLYLHKATKEQEARGFPKECFVLKKPEQLDPIPLIDTTKKTIEEHGVKTNNLFVIFDEMRIIGTDVELADDGIFLNTANQIPMWTALQGSIRARKVFKDQENEFIVTAKGRKEMVDEGKNLDGLFLTFAKNEGKSLKDQEDRSRIAQIEDCVLSDIMAQFRGAKSINKIGEIATKNEKFLVSDYSDEPYLHYGRIEGQANALTVLEIYHKSLLERFEKTGSPNIEAVKDELEKLQRHYKEVIPEDEKMDARIKKDDLGCTLEVEINEAINLELEDEKEIDLDNEILNELHRLKFSDASNAHNEIPWDLSSNSPLSKQLLPQLLSFKDAKMNSSLCNFSYFPENIKMTKNYYQTSIKDLPLYHLYSKRAGFLLVVERELGKYDFVLISEKEASFFKDWIGQHPCKDVTLINLQGVPELDSQELKLEITQEELQRNLWYPHLAKGDIDYIENHANISKELIKNNKDNISKYLQLKLAFNKKGLRKLFTTDLFDLKQTRRGETQYNGVIFSDRRKYIEDCYNLVRRLGQEEVEKLEPSQVEDLAEHQIGWLITKEQIGFVAAEQAPYIKKELRHYIERPEALLALPDDKDLTISQKQKLSHYFLKEFREDKLKIWHLQYLPSTSIARLKKENLIKAIPQKYVSNISQDQAAKLSSQETSLISNLNYPAFLGIQKEFIYLLMENQIKQLDPKKPLDLMFITKLNADQIGFLSNEVLQFIQPSQLKSISEKDFKRIVKKELLLTLEAVPHRKYLTVTQKGILTDEIKKLRANSIPFHCLEFISPEQVSDLSDKKRIKELPAEKLYLIKRDKLEGFDMSDFSKPFIESLNNDAIKVLNKSNFCILAKYLIPKQLSSLDDSLLAIIRQLSKTQLKHVTDSVLQKIETHQANNLDDGDLYRLTAPHLIQELGSDKLAKVNDQAIQSVKPMQLIDMSEKDFKRISKIELLMNEEAGSRSHLLTEQQIKNLNKEFKHVISRLSKEQLHLLNDEALQEIQPSQLTTILGEDFKRILKSDLLMSPEAEPHFHLLTDDQKNKLIPLIQALPADQVPIHCLCFVLDDQVRNLGDKTKIKKVVLEKVHLLSSQQVAMLDDDDFSPEFIKRMNNEAVTVINARFSNLAVHLEKAQLVNLDKSHTSIIKKLTPQQLKYVKPDVLQEISKMQVATLLKADLNRLTNPDLVLAIPSNRVGDLSKDIKDKERLKKILSKIKDKKSVPSHLKFLLPIWQR